MFLEAARPGPPGHGSRSNSPPARAGGEAVEDCLGWVLRACCSNVNSTVEFLLSRAGARCSGRRVVEDDDAGTDTTTGALATAAFGTCRATTRTAGFGAAERSGVPSATVTAPPPATAAAAPATAATFITPDASAASWVFAATATARSWRLPT